MPLRPLEPVRGKNDNPPRLYIISFAVAVLCLLPQIAMVKGWDLPPWLLNSVFIPAAGLGYLEVFFHELGHCVAGWSFGIVTVPSFNFSDGGGLASQITNRIMFLQIAVYLGVLWVAWMMWSDEQYD